MKYSVKFSCGHTHTIQLFGKNSERDRKIEWMERCGDCPDCHQAKKGAEHKQKSEAAALENQQAQLPTLSGTVKQVAWAETIRNELLKDTDRVAEVIERKIKELEDGKHNDRGETFVTETIQKGRSVLANIHLIKNKTAATWWIDNRHQIVFDYHFFVNFNAAK